MKCRHLLPLVLTPSLLAACGSADRTPPPPPRVAAEVERIRAEEIPEIDSETGTVVSDDRIEIASRVTGFIRRLEVREGQHVSRGEPLAEIDPVDVDEAIRQAQAGVAAARADWQDAQHDLTAFTTGAAQGWTSADTLRKAQMRAEVAQATVKKAEAALAGAEAQKPYTRITSPVDGVVVARTKRQGDIATPGVPLLVVEARQSLLFKVYVPETQVGGIEPGQHARVRIDALPGREIASTVRRIVPSGDPVTRRYEVDLDLPADAQLLPGMFGRASLVVGQGAALTLPRQALVERGGLQGVFVVDDTNLAHFRWLRLGREVADRREVTAGLAAGERIVSHPDAAVREGVQITPEGDPHG